jgi:fido (protein-threonine AMPylation protein)
MATKLTEDSLRLAIVALAEQGHSDVSSTQLIEVTGGSPTTIKRLLAKLQSGQKISRAGRARGVRYSLIKPSDPSQLRRSEGSLKIGQRLAAPLATRVPVTYQRDFVDNYRPNHSALIPRALADELNSLGRMQGQQPAGTYARKVLEPLLMDLSWSSSQLEGNRYSLLATEELFRGGISNGNADAVMLLNHKNAIEFLVDTVPTQGLTIGLVRNLHALLMQDLLADTNALGAVRTKIVNISDTTYVPTQVPLLLQEMLESIISKARLVNNPIEASFFLWINLAYLQPFEDGNKRTGRLAANIPLMLHNCAPLSFLDVATHDYVQAMLGVYEFRDVSLAMDLYEWTYRRSLQKYAVLLESLGAPDPLRLRYRERLNDAIGMIVRDRKPFDTVMVELGLTDDVAPGFRTLFTSELHKLESYNCARYRLTMNATEAWIVAGRPVGP